MKPLSRRESILIFSQLFLVVQHRLVQPRNLLTNHINLGSKQRKLFFPRDLLGSFLSCNPCTHNFQNFLWQPKRLQIREDQRWVSQTLVRRRHKQSGHHFRRRLTSATIEAPQDPFRRIDGQPLFAWLTRVVRLSLRPLATIPSQPRCTHHSRPAEVHRTDNNFAASASTHPCHKTGKPIPQESGAVSPYPHRHGDGNTCAVACPAQPQDNPTCHHPEAPCLPRPGRKHPHGPQT